MPPDMTPDEQPAGLIRLNRALALAGVASRRAADEMIQAGLVVVNGRVADSPGLRVDPAHDTVLVRGVSVRLASPEAVDHAYVVMHKPVQVVTTAKDPQGRTTVLDLLPAELKARRLLPAGRLDLMSEGLILLSNDGELNYRLTQASRHLPKVYEVRVRGRIQEPALEVMRRGMRLSEGERLAPVEARVVDRDKRGDLLRLVLVQGVNRQIRRMCRDLGLTILRLVRVSIGPIELGDLPPGKWRHLSGRELARLKAELEMS